MNYITQLHIVVISNLWYALSLLWFDTTKVKCDQMCLILWLKAIITECKNANIFYDYKLHTGQGSLNISVPEKIQTER